MCDSALVYVQHMTLVALAYLCLYRRASVIAVVMTTTVAVSGVTHGTVVCVFLQAASGSITNA